MKPTNCVAQTPAHCGLRRNCATDEVLTELRDRMKKDDMVVKVVPFEAPSPTVEELIADLRRLHGVVVKRVRRVRTESDRLMAKDARAKAAKAKRERKATLPVTGSRRKVA